MKKLGLTSELLDRVKLWASLNKSFLIVIGCVLVVFTAISLYAASAPGLYMDAINPDYEVVKIFNPDAPVTIWEAPGDLLFQRFPVMCGLYAGSFITYWAIPFYGILGHSIMSVRVAHLCAGIVLICCIALLTRQLTKSSFIAALVSFLIAIDPTFIFALRTQAYITIFPIIFVTLALFVLSRSLRPRNALVAGTLLGLAAFGYFVYLFVMPGVVLYVATAGSVAKRMRPILFLVSGIVIGMLPYALSYALVFANLGIPGGLAWLHSALSGLHVAPTDNSYGARVISILSQSHAVLSGQWVWATFWQENREDIGEATKAFLIVLIPLLGLAAQSNGGLAKRNFLLVGLPAASFVICATYFGPRLGGHDLSSVLTFAYLTTAMSIALLLQAFGAFRRPLTIVFALVAVIIFISNVSTTASVAAKLGRDSGGGLYSSFISKIPEDAEAQPAAARTPYIFWDWGEMMPFIYETGGTIPAYTGDQLLPAICKYGGAKVVFLRDDAITIPEALPSKTLSISQNDLLHDPSSGFPYRILFAKASHPQPGCATSIVSTPVAATQSVSVPPQGLSAPQRVVTEPQQAAQIALAQPIASAEYPIGILKSDKPEARVGGIYPVANGGEKCCWVSKDVQFAISNSSRKASVVINLFVPSIAPWSDDPGSITSLDPHGRVLDMKSLKGGLQSVTLKVDPRSLAGGIQTVRLRFSQEVNPQKLGINGDERNLSVIIASVDAG